MEDTNYKLKYLKYKSKYLKLKGGAGNDDNLDFFLKNDVKAMLQMANKIKREYDELLERYKSEKASSSELQQLENDLKELNELETKVEEDLENIEKV
jgi:hypothetical protein